MTTFKVNGVTHSNKPAENYNLTLNFSPALQSKI